MGVPPFLLANTINTSVAQRLIRKLCTNCKAEQPTDLKDWPRSVDASLAPETQFVSVGCDDCHYTGYKGRTAVYEVIPIDMELAEAIKKADMRVEHLLLDRGIVSLSRQALKLIQDGTTSLEEAYPLLTELQ